MDLSEFVKQLEDSHERLQLDFAGFMTGLLVSLREIEGRLERLEGQHRRVCRNCYHWLALRRTYEGQWGRCEMGTTQGVEIQTRFDHTCGDWRMNTSRGGSDGSLTDSEQQG